MTSRAEVFRLEPFHFESLDPSRMTSLPVIAPRFSLPLLEDGNASDRLLAGLRGGRPGRPVNVDESEGKGKEKEVMIEEPHEDEGLPIDEGDFWLNVVDSEPGPSKLRLSRVRPQLAIIQRVADVKPRMWDDLRDPLVAEDPAFLSEASIFTFDALIST
jgi:hypothetical protein